MADPGQSADLQRRVTQLSGEGIRPLHLLEQSHQTSRKFNNSSKLILKRTIPISNNNLTFPQPDKSQPPLKKVKAGGSTNEKPGFVTYEEFMTLEQAGTTYIAFATTQDHSLVAIKHRPSITRNVKTIYNTDSDNLVNLLDVFEKGEETHVVYELMDVSLRVVNGVRSGQWQAFEIAAICKEVISTDITGFWTNRR